MSVRMSEMASKTKTLTLDWDGEDVEVSFFPNKVTPDFLETVDEAAKKEDLSVLGAFLEPVVEWWDILLDDGSRMPCNADTVRQVPMRFLNKLQTQLQKESDPPE